MNFTFTIDTAEMSRHILKRYMAENDNEYNHRNALLWNIIPAIILSILCAIAAFIGLLETNGYKIGINPINTKNTLKNKIFPEVITNALLKMPDEDRICSICASTIENRNTLYITPCMHLYHKDCLADWYVRKPHCPICVEAF